MGAPITGEEKEPGKSTEKTFGVKEFVLWQFFILPGRSSVGHAAALLLTQRGQFKALEDCEACSNTGLLISQDASALAALITSELAQS